MKSRIALLICLVLALAAGCDRGSSSTSNSSGATQPGTTVAAVTAGTQPTTTTTSDPIVVSVVGFLTAAQDQDCATAFSYVERQGLSEFRSGGHLLNTFDSVDGLCGWIKADPFQSFEILSATQPSGPPGANVKVRVVRYSGPAIYDVGVVLASYVPRWLWQIGAITHA